MKLRIAAFAALVLTGTAVAAEDASELAKKLSNPVANMISVPFQLNTNSGFGDGSGTQEYMNIQPVVPFSISPTWNVISRTIIPLINQEDIAPGSGTHQGFGNINQSFFFSPKAPTSGGLIWGFGPQLVLPTAGDGLGIDQLSLGVTGVALKQTGPWTLGILANNVWSVTNNDKYGDNSSAFLQPFVAYATPKATTFTLNSEATYDWNTEEWSVPINFTVSQVVKLDGHPVSIAGGVRYWADSPEGGPDGWGLRAVVTYLFPQ